MSPATAQFRYGVTSTDVEALPAMYICVAQSSIKTIAIGRVPSKDDTGSYDYTADPIYIVAGCYDCTAQYIDLRDPNCVNEIISTRSESLRPHVAAGKKLTW